MALSQLRSWLNASPLRARVVPFVVFLILTSLQGQLGSHSLYWVYLGKSVIGAILLWMVWPAISEMRWRWSWDAFAVGLMVFVLWVGLEGYYPSLTDLGHRLPAPLGNLFGAHPDKSPGLGSGWNPPSDYADSAWLAWLVIAGRILASSAVVPPLEETFYRSFLYRYLASANFDRLPLSSFRSGPFLLSALIFGLAHREWLPGILCGMAYQGLVIRHGRLGEAMTAHAITNALLGCWVALRGAWVFW